MSRDLVVSEVFGPTFQGEGPSIGRRVGFVRLGRCNLDCVWCDTPYTWDWQRHDPAIELTSTTCDEVLERLADMVVDHVVVTGGEPLLQQAALVPLLRAGRDRGWTFEVETNGTIVPTEEVCNLVERFNVSPKLANSGVTEGRRLRKDALGAFAELGRVGRAAFKFVVTSTDDLDEVGELAERFSLTPVWVMPEARTTGAVLAGMQALAEPVLERGWHLSPRLHVLLWGDERGH